MNMYQSNHISIFVYIYICLQLEFVKVGEDPGNSFLSTSHEILNSVGVLFFKLCLDPLHESLDVSSVISLAQRGFAKLEVVDEIEDLFNLVIDGFVFTTATEFVSSTYKEYE